MFAVVMVFVYSGRVIFEVTALKGFWGILKVFPEKGVEEGILLLVESVIKGPSEPRINDFYRGSRRIQEHTK